jgi:hypothetical protein
MSRLAGPWAVFAVFGFLASTATAAPPAIPTRRVVLQPPPMPKAAAPAPAAQGAPQAAQAPSASPGNEDAAIEAERARAELQKAYEQINAMNPLSATYGKGLPAGASDIPADSPIANMQRLLSNPAVQGYLKFFSNPFFSKGLEQIMNSPKRANLAYGELGLILFVLVLRAWRQAKANHWLKRLWVSVWTTGVYLAGASVVVPWLILGDPYYETLKGAFLVWQGM